MDKTTIERLQRLGEANNVWDRFSSSAKAILELQTTECNIVNDPVHYWPNGLPTVNLPELEIASKKVKVFYQNPQAGYVTKIGISLNRGVSTIELTDLFGAGIWRLSADGQQVSPDASMVDDVSDLLDSYHDGLLQIFGNNYVEAVTFTKPLPQTAY